MHNEIFVASTAGSDSLGTPQEKIIHLVSDACVPHERPGEVALRTTPRDVELFVGRAKQRSQTRNGDIGTSTKHPWIEAPRTGRSRAKRWCSRSLDGCAKRRLLRLHPTFDEVCDHEEGWRRAQGPDRSFATRFCLIYRTCTNECWGKESLSLGHPGSDGSKAAGEVRPAPVPKSVAEPSAQRRTPSRQAGPFAGVGWTEASWDPAAIQSGAEPPWTGLGS
jgi:hypothetical protein